MPPKATQAGTAISTDQIQLLCQVVQYSEPPSKEKWDLIATKLGIINGSAAQQRFGRLQKFLKAADTGGSGASSNGDSPASTKTPAKRSAPGKANGSSANKSKSTSNAKKVVEGREEAELDDGDDDDEDLETPSKKVKSEKQSGGQNWKSVFGAGEVIKIEDEADDGIRAGESAGEVYDELVD